MKIELLHYELKRQWQMHHSYRRGLSDTESDLVLQDATNQYFEYFAFGRNTKKLDLGAEETFQRADMLSTLLEYVQLDPGSTVDGSISIALPSNYATYREAHADTDCGKLDVFIYPHSEMNEVLRSFHSRPSKKFKRACGFLRNNTLYVYLPQGVTMSKLHLYYYRTPAKVCLGTYPELPSIGQAPGPNLTKTESDLPERYHHLLISIAVQELARTYGDVNRLNLQTEKILSTT